VKILVLPDIIKLMERAFLEKTLIGSYILIVASSLDSPKSLPTLVGAGSSGNLAIWNRAGDRSNFPCDFPVLDTIVRVGLRNRRMRRQDAAHKYSEKRFTVFPFVGAPKVAASGTLGDKPDTHGEWREIIGRSRLLLCCKVSTTSESASCALSAGSTELLVPP
jgi:hypothetical protein